LTVEAAAMAKVPLAGTNYVPGVTEERTLAEMKGMLEKLVYEQTEPTQVPSHLGAAGD
jgi:hypothetical protein